MPMYASSKNFSSVGRITEVVIPNRLVVGMTQYMQSQYIGLTEDEILWVEILFVVIEPNFRMIMVYEVAECHSRPSEKNNLEHERIA